MIVVNTDAIPGHRIVEVKGIVPVSYTHLTLPTILHV